MTPITASSDLEKALQPFAQAAFVTVDTEFHRQSTYFPKLCLIQIACPGAELLIDPLAENINLAPFFALMRNPAVLKVFHAARQDIEILFLLSGIIPAPLFDTQIAASVCGYGESAAYDTLVRKITGAQLDKSSRITDWRQRPLSAKQLDYALADVTYLRDVYAALAENLRQSGRSSWLNEEMAILNNPETYIIPPEQAWKKVKTARAKPRKPQQWTALQKLAAWRENVAQQKNLPRGHVLADESLLEIALQLPADKEALLSLRARQRSASARLPLDASAVLAAVREAQEAPADISQFVTFSSAADQHKSEAEILKLLLKIIADRHQVAAKMIAGSEDIGRLAAEGAKADIAAMRGWRFELYGEQALAMLAGRLAIKFESGAPALFSL